MLVNSNRRRWALAGVATLAAVGAYVVPTAQANEVAQPSKASSASRAAAPPLQEVWKSDFDGEKGSLPSSDDWIIDKGTSYPGGAANWGTGEVETYTDSPDNVQLDGDGHLRITALKNGDSWTSARIETKRTDFTAPKGGKMRIEASIKTPDEPGDAGAGYWPAFWTLGDKFRGNYQNWPGVGEFDIMENVNGTNTTYGTLHCGTSPGGPCGETTGIGKSHECSGSCSGDYHKYALELDRTSDDEELRWYVDGEQYHSVKKSSMDAKTWADATDHGEFLLLNLAMGGGFPDGVSGQKTPTAATRSGGSMSVDYVSVETTGGSAK
jgi:beta-glucanase (GH16 family)